MTTVVATPFSWESTADDVIEGVDLVGRRAIVTGGASGIGVETARALAGAGAAVTLAVRDVAAGEQVAADLRATTADAHVDVHAVELADRDSIDIFTRAWDGPLDILVNNAGVMALPERTLTSAGQEMQFAVNHLGHFRLALGLHDALAAADGGARIVSLSSRGHLRAAVDFDDLTFARRPYEPMIAYGQSKTANVLFAVEVDRRWRDEGIRANAVHPGAIIETNLARHYDPVELQALVDSGAYRFKTHECVVCGVPVARRRRRPLFRGLQRSPRRRHRWGRRARVRRRELRGRRRIRAAAVGGLAAADELTPTGTRDAPSGSAGTLTARE
jgi:NAD(P)-dependent dehydrogenase (short-subunit alcohol dehydrogenase family)